MRIEDEACAFDFDMAATTRLLFFDLEQEKMRIEAIATAGLTGGVGNPKMNGKQQLAQITQANFRDQKF